MIPIGIVTRDRVAYLDVTLRSLSATDVPPDTTVTIYDDHSVEDPTRRYYRSNEVVAVATHWPSSPLWCDQGFGIISDDYVRPVGIAGLVRVRQLGTNKPLGVVNASCRAICHLFETNPDSPGIILLQDDVLFKADWYTRLTGTVENSQLFSRLPVGLMAGLKINYRVKDDDRELPAIQSGITAQCLYISRAAFTALPHYFQKHHRISKKFDDTLRRAIIGTGLWAGCIYPFVCQHFGIQSLVRPDRKWMQGRKGRIGFYVHPPYALAAKVSCFKR